MNAQSKKNVVVATTAVLGLGVLVATAALLKNPLLEQYDLYRMRTQDDDQRYSAANRLVERKCLAVIPELLKTCCKPISSAPYALYALIPVGRSTSFGSSCCNCASLELLRRLNAGAIPGLVRGVRFGEQTECRHALLALGLLGPEAHSAIPWVERVAVSDVGLSALAGFVLEQLRVSGTDLPAISSDER